LADLEPLPAAPDDALDRWASQREQRLAGSTSARYVSTDVVGYEDLDAEGSWRVDASYGNVWTPNRVASDWTPYRDGHWAWVNPWGWTWVDDAPWGYAVSHYGRWARIHETWSWVPGPQREPAVYAPALVVFLGGGNFRTAGAGGGANVGWFPLAPREVYQPAYPVSRGYFERVNRSNAVIAPGAITTIYNQVNNTKVSNTTNVVNVTKAVYVNQQVKGAVVAVPAQAFAQSRPVAQAAVPVAHELVRSATVAVQAVAAPPDKDARGGAPEARSKPPQERHAVVVRTPPSAAPASAAAPASVTPLAPAPRVHLLAPGAAATPPALPAKPAPVQARPDPGEAAGKAQGIKADVIRAEAERAQVQAQAAKEKEKEKEKAQEQSQAQAAKAQAQAQAQAVRKAAAATEQAAKVQAQRENAARASAAEAAAKNPPSVPRGPKSPRELRAEEELRRAEEASKKH
jgi:hypothetical protein